MSVLGVRPGADAALSAPSDPSPAAPDAGSIVAMLSQADAAPPPTSAPSPTTADAPPAQRFSVCQEGRVGCDAQHVRVLKSEPDLCVQLTMDNCSANDRRGLAVAMPAPWHLASGAVSTDRDCDLQEPDPQSALAEAGSGKIAFLQRGSSVSALEVDVRLLLNPPSGSMLPTDLTVTTAAPIATIDPCGG